MSDLETLLNKSSCWSLAEKVNDQCNLFLDDLGLNYFDYTRFYKDGTFFPLFNDKEYLSFILNHGKAKHHQEYVPPTTFLYPGIYFWSSYIEPSFLLQADKKFKHYHGITIIKSGELYDEAINFSAPFDCSEVMEIYQHHRAMLEYFCSVIVGEFNQIIEKRANRSVLPSKYSPKKYDTNYFPKVKSFIEKLYAHHKVKKNQVLLPLSNGLVTVSKTEFNCLQILITGVSNKEIAKQLSVSPRTIDTLLERLMRKTNTSNRLALINLIPKFILDEIAMLIKLF